jgi:hypothetical protein
MTSEIKVRLADQNAIKVVGSLKNYTSISDIPGVNVAGAIDRSLLHYNASTQKWIVTNELDADINPRIKIKRTTSSATSPTLQYGELGVSVGIGTAGNTGGRLWIGNNSGTSVQVGGEYYVSILDHEPGTLTANSAAIVNSSKYIDYWNVTNDVVVGGVITSTSLIVTGVSTIATAVIGSVGISSNVISTKPGSGDILYIDPNANGLSNAGTVIIKGNLQVDGESSIINSTSLSSNEIILNLGDVTSIRTVIGNVSSGSSIFTLDSVVGVNTGDLISNIIGLHPENVNRTITSYSTLYKTITISGITTAGISSGAQMTITHSYDTNTDRGISFEYNDSTSGIGYTANRKGFFGYDDSSKKWTYIPEVTIVNGVVSGTKGYIDIRGIYLQSSEVNQYGITYLDSDGFVNQTVSPGSGISTSNYILTTSPGTNIPTWTNTIDGGSY